MSLTNRTQIFLLSRIAVQDPTEEGGEGDERSLHGRDGRDGGHGGVRKGIIC